MQSQEVQALSDLTELLTVSLDKRRLVQQVIEDAERTLNSYNHSVSAEAAAEAPRLLYSTEHSAMLMDLVCNHELPFPEGQVSMDIWEFNRFATISLHSSPSIKDRVCSLIHVSYDKQTGTSEWRLSDHSNTSLNKCYRCYSLPKDMPMLKIRLLELAFEKSQKTGTKINFF